MNSRFIYIFTGLLLFNASYASGSEKTLYTASCDDTSSISIKVSVHRHLLDFERGDGLGYGLFYDVPGKKEIPIYNNGFDVNDNHVIPAWYVGWGFAPSWSVGQADYGKRWVYGRTNDFAPLPGTKDTPQLKIFELPKRTYNRNAHPPELDNPPFMNIFLSHTQVSETEFTTLANCLKTHKEDIDKKLLALGSYFPDDDQRFYHPLRLGGVVYGMPPYDNPKYIEMINSIWGETLSEKVIPAFGRFTLYPGQSAKGKVNGRAVIVSVSDSSQPELQVDEKKITGWYTPCGEDNKNCQTIITIMNQNSDKSITFDVSNKNKYGAYDDIH
jgi:hypothetical protein